MGHLITDNPVLSAAQKRILLELPESLRQRFVFAGGTALAAFHLQHRLSEDLDFFARQADTEVWGADIELSLASKFRVLTQERIYDRRIYHLDAGGIVKVEFVPLYFSRLQPPIHIDALWVEDLPDLAANKIMALADRFDIKDFVDVYCIAQHTGWTVAAMIRLARRKHAAPYEYQLHLSRVRGQAAALQALRLLRPLDPEALWVFFHDQEQRLIREQLEGSDGPAHNEQDKTGYPEP
jgi:predicted nucleotidyltransferase component of viral defense system